MISLSRVRRAFGALKARSALAVPRSHYDKTWERLGRDGDAAKLAVAGYVDEAEIRRTAAATLAVLRETVGIEPQDVVLEIGCGVGRVGEILAPIVREWIGCDVAETMLGHARQRLAAFPNVRTVKISGYDLAPIPSESVDVVYSTVVFMHLEEWDRYSYVLEAMRVLRPGGRLYVDNVDLTGEDGWALFESLRAIPPARRPPYISKTSTPEELLTFLRRAGFEQIDHSRRALWVLGWGRKPKG